MSCVNLYCNACNYIGSPMSMTPEECPKCLSSDFDVDFDEMFDGFDEADSLSEDHDDSEE